MRRKLAVFLVFLVSFTIVYSSIAFFLLSTPPSQPFMGFGVFSENGSLYGYFQGPGPDVKGNQTISWHLQVANRMGSIQFAKVVFRLENLTTETPTETNPGNSPPIGDSSFFVPNGENSTVDFTWEILHTSLSGNLTFLTLLLNGQQVSPGVGATSGAGFRFVFELWTLDNPSSSFQYGWQGQNTRIGTWLQVWFNVIS